MGRSEETWFGRGSRPRDAVALSWFPFRPEERGVLYPRTPDRSRFDAGLSLPVPPEELRFGYGRDAKDYHALGVRDATAIRAALLAAGAPIESARRILEFGCAAGRILRAFEDLAPSREIWGCDVMGAHIAWCRQFLAPPFHFLTNTLVPHLPFEDRYFDVVYAGSVFTHFEDMAAAWMLELRRIVRPGGHVHVTLADRSTIALLAGPMRDHPFAKRMREVPEYERLSRSDFGMFSIRTKADRVHSMLCTVFHDLDHFRRGVEPFLEVVSVAPGAHGYQTGVLLRRQ